MSHTQFLLRFDDICPTMNWRVWAEIETVLVQRQFKPILAVVPDNRDPELQVDTPADDFWEQAERNAGEISKISEEVLQAIRQRTKHWDELDIK